MARATKGRKVSDAEALIPTVLSQATSERPGCQACGLFRSCRSPFGKPSIPVEWTKKLLVVKDYPSNDKETTEADAVLRRVLANSGYLATDIGVAYALRCPPKPGTHPSMQQVRACRPFLLRVIEVAAPRFILAVGDLPLRALANVGNASVTKSRGKPLRVPCVLGGGDGDRVSDVSASSTIGSPSFSVTYDPRGIAKGRTHLLSRIKKDVAALTKAPEMWPADEIPNGKTIGFDTEYGPSNPLITIGLANEKQAVALEGDARQEARPILAQAEYLVGHGVANDVTKLIEYDPSLVKEEWATGEKTLCSLLLARMEDENGDKGSYELETLLLGSGVRVEPWKWRTTYKKSDPALKDASLWPESERRLRCRLDAWSTRRCASASFKRLPEHRRPLLTYTHRIAAVLERMSLAGAFVHMERFTEQETLFHQDVERCADRLRKLAATHGVEDFSPTNDDHLRVLLYDKLALPVLSRTEKDKKASVAKLTLANLANDHPDKSEIPSLLVEYSKVDKRYSVNGVGLRKLLTPCGLLDGGPVAWLPFHINPLGARTGRRSSANPNSQNWPRSVRGIVRSRWSGGSVGDHDYQKLEVILIAWVSGDERLLHDFTVGRGYFDVAKGVLGIEVVKDTPQYTAVKSIALGVHYNMQTRKMAQQLWNGTLNDAGELQVIRFSADYAKHEEEVDRLRRAYLARYPSLRAYMRRQRDYLLAHQAAVSYVGRVRHLPLTNGERTPGFGHMLNEAINFPIQSLASDVTGSALMDIEEELLRLHGLSYVDYLTMLVEARKKVLTNPSNQDIIYPVNMSLLFNEVHDSIIVDFHPDHVKRDQELVVESMRAVRSLRRLAPGFDVKLGVDTKLGPYWGGK